MKIKIKARRQSGFSLVELLMVVLLLSIVVGALFTQIDRAQVRYRVEDQRLDMTQQEREFIDQFVRDMHQAGYPAANMYSAGAVAANSVAGGTYGLISLSDSDVQIEGDTDGDGNVEAIEYSYDATCQCIRRSSLLKGTPGPATKFTEVQGVIGTSQKIFAAYDANGNSVDLSVAVTDPATLKTIKSLRITITTQGIGKDNDSHQAVEVSMTSIARLVNNQGVTP
jgi:prepilin-type N-terminal cleavage/methylation domain-containing protein